MIHSIPCSHTIFYPSLRVPLGRLWGKLRLLQLWHQFTIAKIHPHSKHQEHSGTTEEKSCKRETRLLKEILQPVNRLKVNWLSNVLDDLTSERMHETILTACRSALDHQKGKNLIWGNDFHEILAAGQLGTI